MAEPVQLPQHYRGVPYSFNMPDIWQYGNRNGHGSNYTAPPLAHQGPYQPCAFTAFNPPFSNSDYHQTLWPSPLSHAPPMNVHVYNCSHDESRNTAPGGSKNQSCPNGSSQKKGSENKNSDAKEGGAGDTSDSKKGGSGKATEKKKPISLLNCLCTTRHPGLERLSYDLRDSPETAIVLSSPSSPVTSIRSDHRTALITSEPFKSIKLISKLFPWSIEVRNDTGITLDDLVYQLHEALSSTLTEGEYWACVNEHRARMATAFDINCESWSPLAFSYDGARPPTVFKPRYREEGLRRIDWLLGQTMFLGLEKDPDFISYRITDKKLHAETWVVVLGKNPS